MTAYTKFSSATKSTAHDMKYALIQATKVSKTYGYQSAGEISPSGNLTKYKSTMHLTVQH